MPAVPRAGAPELLVRDAEDADAEGAGRKGGMPGLTEPVPGCGVPDPAEGPAGVAKEVLIIQ
jgi:hypothetical protein